MESQAVDRLHRMGQKEEVKVFHFITPNTVEEKIQLVSISTIILTSQAIDHSPPKGSKKKTANGRVSCPPYNLRNLIICKLKISFYCSATIHRSLDWRELLAEIAP